MTSMENGLGKMPVIKLSIDRFQAIATFFWIRRGIWTAWIIFSYFHSTFLVSFTPRMKLFWKVTSRISKYELVLDVLERVKEVFFICDWSNDRNWNWRNVQDNDFAVFVWFLESKCALIEGNTVEVDWFALQCIQNMSFSFLSACDGI